MIGPKISFTHVIILTISKTLNTSPFGRSSFLKRKARQCQLQKYMNGSSLRLRRDIGIMINHRTLSVARVSYPQAYKDWIRLDSMFPLGKDCIRGTSMTYIRFKKPRYYQLAKCGKVAFRKTSTTWFAQRCSSVVSPAENTTVLDVCLTLNHSTLFSNSN